MGGEAPPLQIIMAPPTSGDVRRNLGMGKGSKRKRWLWRGLMALLLIGVVAAVLLWRNRAADEPTDQYVTLTVARGDLEATITATGSLRGRDTVDVGAEISGTVRAVHVDFNDTVKAGQVLCEIDPQELSASRNQAQAQVLAARASYSNARATAREAQLAVERSRQLAKEGLISQQQLEAAEAAAARASASARSAAAQITLNSASLELARTKLDKTKIIAPMDGVVLSRTVEVGQTVAASLQAPILFTLARNLQQMELTVSIDEADIGQVKQGQPATFKVDAFPERDFEAQLSSVHNIGTLVDNVVTYQALLTVDNPDMSLRPGMTATATIVTAARKDVILVPNSALRYRPPAGSGSGRGVGGPRIPGMGPMGRSGRSRPSASGASSAPAPSASGSARPAGGPGRDGKPRSQVWVLRAGEPKRIFVETRLSDGEFTEIAEGKLKAGDQVIIDMKQIEQ